MPSYMRFTTEHQRYMAWLKDRREQETRRFRMRSAADAVDQLADEWRALSEGRNTSVSIFPGAWQRTIQVWAYLTKGDSLKRELGWLLSRARTAGFQRQRLDNGVVVQPRFNESDPTVEIALLWPQEAHEDKPIRLDISICTGDSQVCRWEGTGEFDVIPEHRVEKKRLVCDDQEVSV